MNLIKKTQRVILASLASASLMAGQALCEDTQSPQRSGLDIVADIESLPIFLPAGTQTKQFSSYDLSGGNRDGMYSDAFGKYIDENGEYVLFDAFGPGTLYRQQLNIWSAFNGAEFINKPGAGDSRLRYYIDDGKNPVIDATVDELYEGSVLPISSDYVFTGDWGDVVLGIPLPTPEGGKVFGVNYFPIDFAERLKVTFVPSEEYNRNSGGDSSSWYQFTYLEHPADTRIESGLQESPESAKAVLSAWKNLGEDPKATPSDQVKVRVTELLPGEEKAIFEHAGAGAIWSLKFKVEPASEAALFDIWIKASWDGQKPSIYMPLASFFGGGGSELNVRSAVAENELSSLMFGYDSASGEYYSYWPMPYWYSAKIELVNKSEVTFSATSEVGVVNDKTSPYSPEKAGHFYAKRTVYADDGNDNFAPIFREQGLGHVVGRTLYSEGFAMDGDEFTYIDGKRTPTIHGDGIEDDHNQGWGGAPYRQPLWGAVVNGYQGAFRLHLTDRYVFKDKIEINYEHSKLFRSANSQTDAVVFYYKAGSFPRGIKLTDSIDVGMPLSETAHNYSVEGETWSGSMRSSFDTYEKQDVGLSVLEEGRAHRGASHFTAAIHPSNIGVRLRRLVNRSQSAYQSADVYVDGQKLARPWHFVVNASSPGFRAWHEIEYEIPASATAGKSEIQIEVRNREPERSEINEYHYWIFSHVPPRTF